MPYGKRRAEILRCAPDGPGARDGGVGTRMPTDRKPQRFNIGVSRLREIGTQPAFRQVSFPVQVLTQQPHEQLGVRAAGRIVIAPTGPIEAGADSAECAQLCGPEPAEDDRVFVGRERPGRARKERYKTLIESLPKPPSTLPLQTTRHLEQAADCPKSNIRRRHRSRLSPTRSHHRQEVRVSSCSLLRANLLRYQVGFPTRRQTSLLKARGTATARASPGCVPPSRRRSAHWTRAVF